MSLFVGIDPGLSGGIAFLSGTPPFEHLHLHKMPATERDIYHLLNEHADGNLFATIEKVHSFPGQGVASTFKFAMNYGLLRGILIAALIPFEEVSPIRWQKAMECLSKGDKNITKARAQQLFPGIKITHATADALLIAEYARRKHGNSNAGEDLKQLHKQLKLKIDEHDLSGI